MRQLIVNADDFGFTRDVNGGIVEAHRQGILTAATLMANGEAFEHAVRLAKANPTLDVGCHLVLIQGHSISPPYRNLPDTVPHLLAALASRRLQIHEELSAQVRRILAAGIRPTHLDTHKHTHLLPPVLDAVARLSSEYGIRWVRRPFDVPITAVPAHISWMRRTTNEGLKFLRRRFDEIMDRHGCFRTDHFAGFQITGKYHTRQLARVLSALPAGSTEFMCHPGRCTDELNGTRTRLKASRERELEALTAPETAEVIRAADIRLINYNELERGSRRA
jgi:chitin disaccharide deacetylase